MWNDDHISDSVSGGNFPPELLTRVMIFYVIATIIYMMRVLFHTLAPFHVGHL